MTQEERRNLARTQWADASTALRHAASELAMALGFEPVTIASESPIAAAQLTDGTMTIDFLCGPPEFHVEMFLAHRRFPHSRLGLAELIQYPPIRAWMISHRLQPPTSIASEVRHFGELLLGPCTEAFTAADSFFARFPRNDRNA